MANLLGNCTMQFFDSGSDHYGVFLLDISGTGSHAGKTLTLSVTSGGATGTASGPLVTIGTGYGVVFNANAIYGFVASPTPSSMPPNVDDCTTVIDGTVNVTPGDVITNTNAKIIVIFDPSGGTKVPARPTGYTYNFNNY